MSQQSKLMKKRRKAEERNKWQAERRAKRARQSLGDVTVLSGASAILDQSNDHQRRGATTMRTIEGTNEPISPEAMSDAAWVEHLRTLAFEGGKYIQSLRATNGSTEAPPTNRIIVWGLRSQLGRWLSKRDENGVPSLTGFANRELAELFLWPGDEVVWMDIEDWWRKVEDAAATGFPPTLAILFGVENGETIESTFSCKELAGQSHWFYPFFYYNRKWASEKKEPEGEQAAAQLCREQRDEKPGTLREMEG
jgi:hypothetical protein